MLRSLEKGKSSSIHSKIQLMRVVVDLRRVFGNSCIQDEWEQRMSNIGLAVPFGLVKTGEKPDADAHANISARVSRLVGGQRPLAKGQLIRLAGHTGLDRYFGGPEEAARWLSDEISFEEFRLRLFETHWADPEFAERALYGSRHLLLEAFREFPMTRDGIQVGPEIVTNAARSGPVRGARLPQPEDFDADLPSFALGTRLKVRFDFSARLAVTILEVRPSPGKQHGYDIACLAPSPLAPERVFGPGAVILPSRSFGGLGDHYVIDHPLGRHDWLAMLTEKPLSLPWPTPEDSLHEPSPKQLGMFLRILRDLKNDPVEIRHFAFHATG